MLVEALGTCPAIAGTEEEGGQWKKGGWSIMEEELRKSLTIRTI